VQSGINFDAFGVEMRLGRDAEGIYMHDMLQISAVLDYFGPIGKPLYIVESEVPGPTEAGQGQASDDLTDKWDPERQRAWIENLYRGDLCRTFVDTVVYSNHAEVTDSVIPHSGLMPEKFEPKAAYISLMKLQRLIFGSQGAGARGQ